MQITSKLISPVVAIFNLIVALLLIASAYGGSVAPDISAIPAVVAMTFPLWLILTLICLTINIFFFRKVVVINIISLICCWGSILEYSPFNLFSNDLTEEGESNPKEEFTLMTYNVLNLWDFRYSEGEYPPEAKYNSATLDFIMKSDPDIVALQECSSSDFSNWEKKFPEKKDSLSILYPYRLIGGGNGMSLLSKYPFESVEIPSMPKASSFATACYQMEIGPHSLYLINVHLQSIGLNPQDKALYMELTEGEARTKEALKEVKRDLISKLTNAYRRRSEQAKALRNFINTLPANVILCGDFNDIPGSYSVRTILGDDMHSAFREVGCGPGISYHADRFYFRIDHCLYRGDLKPLKCKVIRHPSSDHYPLLTTFEFTD